MKSLMMVALAMLFPALSAHAQDFEWKGEIPTGKWLEVKGVNGDIRAVLAPGGEARVTATRRARRSDPDSVEIRVVEHSDGVTICAVYPTPPRARRENSCEPGDQWSSNNEKNDVTVAFLVTVPAGVRFRGMTVNGELEAEDLRGDAEVSTVNGSVRVSTTGTAEAQTVNGSIYATMGRADWSDQVEFRTVNGAITLTFPSDLHAEVRAETVNGSIESDWPLVARGPLGPRRISGTIGNGGRVLRLETVNGSIRLRKGT